MNKTEIHVPEKSTLLNVRDFLPLVVLLLSLLFVINLSNGAQRNVDQALQAEFDARVRESNALISQRMRTYEQVLRGVVGFFVGSENVTRDAFRAYAETLQLKENYPGIQAIGFAAFVPASLKKAHILAMRKQGFPGYDIKPPGDRDVYVPIVYIEPFLGINQRALGFDLYTEENSRTVMEQVQRTRKPVATNKIRLNPPAEKDSQYGFIIYLPVYKNTVAHPPAMESRESFLGWVYAPFRMNDLMRALGGEETDDLDLEIYDGGTLSEAARMYDSNPGIGPTASPGRLMRTDLIEFGNHQWLIATTALPGFGARLANDRPALILRGGISFSLLLALLLWVSLDSRARAIQAAQQAMQLALYDTLTGLPNRKLVRERLTQAIAKAKRDNTEVAFLFIDLDKFKPVNDEFGHAIGDLLLKEVAKRLHRCMRASDTVGRLGGDEFVALLQAVEGRGAAMTVAKKILDALTQPFEVAGHRLNIAGSIGIAIYPGNGHDENSLVKNADHAMYEAKNSGRSTIRFAE